MFKYSKAITEKIKSCTSNTTLLADDGQNCVSLEHLMSTTSKSPKFSRCTRKRSIPETHSSILQCNRSPSNYFLRIILKRFHKLQVSSEKLKYLSLSLSPSPPLIVGWNRNSSTAFSERGPRHKTMSKSLPYSPMPLKVAQVGNLENNIYDLNEVTRRIHQNKTSSEQ